MLYISHQYILRTHLHVTRYGSDDSCIFFTINNFITNNIPRRTTWKHCLNPAVAAHFSHLLRDSSSYILPASCEFIVDNFNSKLRSTLDSVAPLNIENIYTKEKPQ